MVLVELFVVVEEDLLTMVVVSQVVDQAAAETVDMENGLVEMKIMHLPLQQVVQTQEVAVVLDQVAAELENLVDLEK
jgi:hypothetical protein